MFDNTPPELEAEAEAPGVGGLVWCVWCVWGGEGASREPHIAWELSQVCVWVGGWGRDLGSESTRWAGIWVPVLDPSPMQARLHGSLGWLVSCGGTRQVGVHPRLGNSCATHQHHYMHAVCQRAPYTLSAKHYTLQTNPQPPMYPSPEPAGKAKAAKGAAAGAKRKAADPPAAKGRPKKAK